MTPTLGARRNRMARLAGVDGCPGGWLSVELDTSTNVISSRVLTGSSDLRRLISRCDVVTIDIPIGLPDAGPRACDLEARRLLAPKRSSSVFPAPVRATLAATSYSEACALSTEACGKSLSKQTYAILDRIRSVDTIMCSDISLQEHVREIHPEVCYYFWNAEEVVGEPKRTELGAALRRFLVEAAFGSVVEPVRARYQRGAVADDDILDAFAALWSTRRLWDGVAVVLPRDPEHDRYGLRMEMVA